MTKDYSKGKIYMIVCNVTKKQYIGSTTKEYLSQRLDKHRSYYKDWMKNKPNRYITSIEVLKNNDYYIKLLELYPCSCNDELRMKEREHQDSNECVNKVKAYSSEEEKNEYHKDYYEVNKDKLLEKAKEYAEEHKVEKQEYDKNRYEENREEKIEKAKEYYKVNKEHKSKKIVCDCGGSYSYNGKLRHERTKKHIAFINSQTPSQ